VPTAAGQEDVLSVSADGTQIRFTPAVEKKFQLTLARQVGSQVRAVAVRGLGGGQTTDVDITVSPEMSLLRVGNRSGAKTVFAGISSGPLADIASLWTLYASVGG